MGAETTSWGAEVPGYLERRPPTRGVSEGLRLASCPGPSPDRTPVPAGRRSLCRTPQVLGGHAPAFLQEQLLSESPSH